MWNIIAGYVIIEIQCLGMEGFLNRAMSLGIRFSELFRVSYTTVRTQVSVVDYLKLKRIPGKVEFRVLKSRGVYALLRFAVRRIPLVIGVLVLCGAVLYCSTLCLGVEIKGIKTVSEFAINRVIQEHGGVRFANKQDIDVSEIAIALRTEFRQLSYASAHFEGVKLVVEVDEGTIPPEIVVETPCDIVANESGVITKLVCNRGKALVREGQKVKKGDVLITGSYDVNETHFDVAAKGVVMAETTYSGSADAYYASEVLKPTGNKSVRRTLSLMGIWEFEIDGSNPFLVYLEEQTVSAIIGENMPVFVKVIETSYLEAKPVSTDEGREAAWIEARENAYNKAIANIPEKAQPVRFSAHRVELAGRIRAYAYISAVSNIGVEQRYNMEIKETQD